MSTPATPAVEEKKAVVEAPSEQQVTEAYLEKRAKGETENLPTPEPVIKAAVVEEEKSTDTDAYIAERSERKRKERGGKAARIDELTREKAELAKEKAEAEAKLKAAEEAKAKLEAKPKEEPKAEPKPEVTPKAKPKMNEFTDIDEYHAAMALWAAEERARTNGAATPLQEPKPDQAVQIAKIRKEEFDNFLEKGRRFVAGHPDFNETLEAAHVRGLTMSEAARTAITRLAVPEVAYWLAKPENDLAARKLMEMDDLQQVVEVGRIAERLKVSPADFVSNAPAPGVRLSGASHVEELPLNQITETDEYIRRRKMEKASMRRGR